MKQSDKTIIIVPAYNEEACIGSLLDELAKSCPGIPVTIIDDGSSDRTSDVAISLGANVLRLPCNLGVGGAVQAGFQYAFERGYDYVIRCDGDGQHPPSEIPKLIAVMKQGNVDLVIGSRFLGEKSYTSTLIRYCGISGLALFLSLICRHRVTDPTSGFQMMNRVMMCFFANCYPMDYPEPEALALLRRQGYEFQEVAVQFRSRTAGVSSIRSWGTLYYVFKVFLALMVDRARPVAPMFSRKNLQERI